MGLDDGVKSQVLEEGQSVNFSLHAVYRPQFAISFYPGSLVLNYELADIFLLVESLRVGPKGSKFPLLKRKFYSLMTSPTF
ncbi:hypothetical protein AKJ45_01705 [candidate division MSBL1 archaeon SCGC-AAA261F19]|uniref:Uncharacterized protein n=1 Tax=candidate division MSBL1 archaeon SCGC-AAA261F19 TaxID=1698275 RepID=A0A133VAC1_9EURY|nr:hypothetical protein AKJ45_01705 [candidate division MSBL1 archaeon SCGC-AAA261F19]